jgi:[acyl-carrier-protein] S-malonyltransferase
VPVGVGAMAAIIGLEHADVIAVCEEASALGSCQIANDNGGGQLVISGEKAAVEKAAASPPKRAPSAPSCCRSPHPSIPR